ncbi:MAG: glycyl-radical enzyme activating protein [Oscillospiraceae bacterium]|jgi:pyruvate formate lyase activating enzyme|nr:glycyl-radical enzyme activating protein [Oscillospiraceae bacterium]
MKHAERACVFNIQHYSLQDGPGIRTTVFFKGCPLHCRWCCNPESQRTEAEPFGEETAGRMMSVDEILAEVEKDEPFYRHGDGGLTVSGGEPLLQGAFLVALLKKAKEHYLTTAIETSGCAPQSILLAAAEYLDTIYFDVKSLNTEKHREWIGRSSEQILENLKALLAAFPEKDVRVRTPVIPGFNDTERDIRNICEFLKLLPPLHYELLPYHSYGKSKYSKLHRAYEMGDAVLDQENFKKLQKIVRTYGLNLQPDF